MHGSKTFGSNFCPTFFSNEAKKFFADADQTEHQVYEMMRTKKTNLKPCKNVVIGLAIYPTASYFNHSCHPGLSRCFQGKQMVLKMLHPVRQGEEVSENYGYAFYLKTKNERRKELSARYWFECGCVACKQNWPLLDKLPKSIETQNKDKIDEEHVEKAAVFMAKGFPNQALSHLTEYVNGFYKDGVSLCQDQIKAEDKARSCISNLGNVVFTEDLILSEVKK